MTRDQILNMSAQELAEATAVHVMGWISLKDGRMKSQDGYMIRSIPDYSTDIAAAWEVFAKADFNEERSSVIHGPYDEWICHIGKTVGPPCKTAPEAICKAALLAVMGT